MRYSTIPEHSQQRMTPSILSPDYVSRRKAMRDMPAEILLEIFESIVDTPPISYDSPWELPESGLEWLWQASRTCCDWRRLIFGTARFWTVIDVGRSCVPLQKALEYSAKLNVQIRFRDPAPIPSAMQILSDHADRIGTLVVVRLDQDTIPSLTQFLSRTSMPELSELWVNTQGSDEDEGLALSLQPSLVPNLRAVHFTERCFDWSSPIIQRLHALYLGRTSGFRDVCGLDEFAHALESCPELKFLKIDGSFPATNGNSQLELSVALPQLKHLRLRNTEPDDIFQTLSCLRFDARADIDVYVSIDCPVELELEQTGIETIIPKKPSSIPLLQTATRAVLNDLDFECWGPGGRGRLAVTFELGTDDGWEYCMDDHAFQCGSLLSQAPVTDLTIYQDDSPPILAWELGYLLRSLPDLVSLEYDGLSYPGTDLLAVLDPSTSSDEVPSSADVPGSRSTDGSDAMVPHLRRLVIVLNKWTDGFLTELGNCLRARASVGLALDELSIGLRSSHHMQSDQMAEELQMALEVLKGLVRGTVEIELESE
ncbi:hypothetical protein K466DRAFT_665227 [Polyporus arcularius HHB13444]|uniref:Uncharacterized protein n=1 Tax=Polyporus arcularius HHB13444 TaxID=1314778 RepID=A0A5C3P5T0_9APHY|nr:hypothetical protein K466DRAFT_665227 [Polyporus arcularius HHB13444]